MRCKIHPSDPGVGVCALCLRQRLSAIAAAEDVGPSPDLRGKPRLFHRSTAPDPFGLRPAEDLSHLHHRSSQIGTTPASSSMFSTMLPHPTHEETESESGTEKPSDSRSWLWPLWGIVRCRRKRNKKMSRFVSVDEQEDKRRTAKVLHPQHVNGRGMSPADKEEVDVVDSDGGYTTDPFPTAASNHNNSHQRNCHRRFSSLGLCFSPLLRPSPGNRKCQATSEVGFSGELRGTFNSYGHRGGAAAGATAGRSSGMGPNRSRKLADFGKYR
ncbi:hypothetical protein AXF42_Ash010015 [Apostasia shenzhenica]|uniref:Uncharacterized protein n=1 Tax=Apostasia shenzhenica TaxID=1088818 RepID=A0A2I0ACP4_9ASPA|nr:hypothetical protein AXF42_Ash010015 [Apostasia shenzhenica]